MINKDFYLKYGLIYGVLAITYLMITYVMGVETMAGTWNGITQMVIFFGVLVFIGLQARKANGGYISYKETFMTIIISYALGAFLFLLFNFILNTLIDPELPGKIYEVTLNNTMKMMEGFGMGDAELEKVYEEMAKEDPYKYYNALGFLQLYFMFLIGGGIGSALAALIGKKNNPDPFAEA